MLSRPFVSRETRRTGAVLVLVAILIPVLLGAVGLVIDAGLLTAAHRQARNAADAAVLSAAVDLMRGRSPTTATATATAFVHSYNGLPAATVTLQSPPLSGPYVGQPRYVEVTVSNPVRTWLIHILGVDAAQRVRARAVAGYELVSPAARIIALDPDARPGLSISGGGSVITNGTIMVNSTGGGVDEFGAPINNGSSGYAATVSNNGTFRAQSIQVAGGVNSPSSFKPFDANLTTSPLVTRAPMMSDPFLDLPPPTTANEANPTVWPAVNVTGGSTVTLHPGIYPSISISSGNVTFQPGMYIIKGGDLKITEDNVTADGVMFYMTGSDYNVSTGFPDVLDGDRPPAAPSTTQFGSVTINASLTFKGINKPASPYHGMLFYQRRWNTKEFSIQGSSAKGNMLGTMYARSARMKISGQGTYGAQWVVGSLATTGNGIINIEAAGALQSRTNQVFLVE